MTQTHNGRRAVALRRRPRRLPRRCRRPHPRRRCRRRPTLGRKEHLICKTARVPARTGQSTLALAHAHQAHHAFGVLLPLPAPLHLSFMNARPIRQSWCLCWG